MEFKDNLDKFEESVRDQNQHVMHSMNTIHTAPILTLFAIIFISAIVSGIVNYLMYNYPGKWECIDFFKYVLWGVFFSSVLLFLAVLISSVAIQAHPINSVNYFAFGCFSFIISIILMLMVKSISGKFPKFKKWNEY